MEHKSKRPRRSAATHEPSLATAAATTTGDPSASSVSNMIASGSSSSERYSLRKRQPIPGNSGGSLALRHERKRKQGPSGRHPSKKRSKSDTSRKGKGKATPTTAAVTAALPSDEGDADAQSKPSRKGKEPKTRPTPIESEHPTPASPRPLPLPPPSHPPPAMTPKPKATVTQQQQPQPMTMGNLAPATTPTPADPPPSETDESEQDDEDEGEDEGWGDPMTLVGPGSLGTAETDAADASSEYDNLFRLQGIFGMRDSHSRFDALLNNLKQQRGRPQLATLQELAEVLSVSNEDTLAGALHSRELVTTLLSILKGGSNGVPSALEDETAAAAAMDEDVLLAMLAADPTMELPSVQGGGNGQSTETMILACQCLSNLLDALPSAASLIVASNGVPVLCEKLEPSDYIDLQEQALYALEKVSLQFPREVVRGGGLNAALKHFHFFTVHFQRSALQTASNCMRGIEIASDDIYSEIQQVSDTLIETLSYPDQAVVDLTCLCWARLIDSCSSAGKERMERIVTPQLLQKMIQLIPVNGNTNSVRPAAFNHLLRAFRAIANCSPRLSCKLLDLGLASRFYQIMTGASSIPENITDAIGSVTMDTKWRDTVSPIMKIIVDLLPPLPEDLLSADRLVNSEPVALRTRAACTSISHAIPRLVLKRHASYMQYNDSSDDLLKSNPELLKRVGRILLPLLIEVYNSMVNVTLRELITHTLVKLVYFCDTATLQLIARHVPLSAFLVEILTQKDHEALVIDALYQAELLLIKVPEVYYSVFEIEGVLHEISSIARLPPAVVEPPPPPPPLPHPLAAHIAAFPLSSHGLFNKRGSTGLGDASTRRYIVMLAQNFMNIYQQLAYQQKRNGGVSSVTGYSDRLKTLRSISQQLKRPDSGTEAASAALERLVQIVNGSSIGISSFELSHSGILDALLHHLAAHNDAARRQAFCDLFLHHTDQEALRKLVDRLQIALGRCEQFQMVTPLEAPNDAFRSPASMLHKQIRVRLIGEGVLEQQRSYTVLVPVVARLKVLEEYLVARVAPFLNSSLAPDLAQEFDDDDSDAESLCDPDVIDSLDRGQDTDDDDDDDDERHEPIHMDEDSVLQQKQTDSRPQENRKEGRWKVHFSARGVVMDSETTVYGAVHRSNSSSSNNMGHMGVWTSTFPLNFRLERLTDDEPAIPAPSASSASAKVAVGATCDKVLQLLAALHDLISHDDDVHMESVDFVNRKLTGKMQRQLEEPLIIASACLPDWTFWLMRKYPFLFPFETRYQFLQSTAFGYTRLMARWQSLQMRGNNNSQHHHEPHQASSVLLGSQDSSSLHHRQQQQPLLHQATRQKVKIPREQMLVSATRIFDHFCASHTTLEVQYTGEEGTGLGPTLEFYAAVSKEFCKRSLGMWRDSGGSGGGSEDDDNDKYVSTQGGLFPAPMARPNKKTLRLFETLGQFVGKAMVDFRIIDMPFSPVFFKVLLRSDEMHQDDVARSLQLLKDIDPVLFRSLEELQTYADKKLALASDTSMTAAKKQSALGTIQKHLEDLCLDFTLPGHPEIMLQENGSNTAVTIDNVDEYVARLLDMLVGSGVSQQMAMFRKGFSSVFDLDHLKVLTPDELVSLFGNSEEDWSHPTIASAIHADHGYTMESRTVQNLVSILSEMSQQEQRDFLQFTTGSPRLPIGGWRAMRPVFTVVRKQCEPPLGADDYLPSVMTCANYLKLPDYSSKEVLHQRLLKSMHEGKNCFLLS